MTERIAILAVDGLDWSLLQKLVDAGRMPFCAQLLEVGTSGEIHMPAPHAAAASWSTLATGTLADRHGVFTDLCIRPDGLTLGLPGAEALQSPPIWQWAARAGRVAKTAGWPASVPGLNPFAPEQVLPIGTCHVSAGFERAEYSSNASWPLAPDAVFPAALRGEVDDARVHPDDIDPAVAIPLLSHPRLGQADPLLRPARWLLARWASMHNLGVHWAGEGDWSLLALRFDGLPGWLQTLRTLAPEIPVCEGLEPWYRYLDMMVGRYMAVLGRGVHLMLLSDAGLPLAPVGACMEGNLFEPMARGGMILAGPRVQADGLLINASALDICPTVLGLLGLNQPANLEGRDLLAPRVGNRTASAALKKPDCASVCLHRLLDAGQTDQRALDWLAGHGCGPIDLSPLQAAVQSVRVESLVAWASVRRLRGCNDDAIEALQQVLTLVPGHLSARLLLGQLLLEADRVEECRSLVEGLPAARQTGVWADVVAGLIAYGAKEWIAAEDHFTRLATAGQAPLNAPGWLGWTLLMQTRWADAEHWFRVALEWPGEKARMHEGLGLALDVLGRSAEAAESFSHAIAEQPSNARLHMLRAKALECEGEFERAQAGFWRAVDLDPSLSAGYERLAYLARMVHGDSVDAPRPATK